MKYEDHGKVGSIIASMISIGSNYRELSLGGVLGVTLRGTYQKEPVIEAVRPTMAQYLRDQYAAKAAELTALGVTEIPPIE